MSTTGTVVRTGNAKGPDRGPFCVDRHIGNSSHLVGQRGDRISKLPTCWRCPMPPATRWRVTSRFASSIAAMTLAAPICGREQRTLRSLALRHLPTPSLPFVERFPNRIADIACAPSRLTLRGIGTLPRRSQTQASDGVDWGSKDGSLGRSATNATGRPAAFLLADGL